MSAALYKPRTYCPNCGAEMYFPWDYPALLCDACWEKKKNPETHLEESVVNELRLECLGSEKDSVTFNTAGGNDVEIVSKQMGDTNFTYHSLPQLRELRDWIDVVIREMEGSQTCPTKNSPDSLSTSAATPLHARRCVTRP